MALGDSESASRGHFTYRDQAQNLGNHLGKLIRIAPDGSVPQDNPFVGRGREAGNLELWPPQPAGRSPSIRLPASYGSRSTVRAAATRSTSSAKAKITAGR